MGNWKKKEWLESRNRCRCERTWLESKNKGLDNLWNLRSFVIWFWVLQVFEQWRRNLQVWKKDSSLDFSFQVFKMPLLRRGFHTLIMNTSFSSPTDVELHNPPPFGAGPASSLALIPFSNWCETAQSTPLQGPASLLAHHLMSTPLRDSASSLTHRPKPGSNTICNDPSPLLADIVLFGLSLPSYLLRFLKRFC